MSVTARCIENFKIGADKLRLSYDDDAFNGTMDENIDAIQFHLDELTDKREQYASEIVEKFRTKHPKLYAKALEKKYGPPKPAQAESSSPATDVGRSESAQVSAGAPTQQRSLEAIFSDLNEIGEVRAKALNEATAHPSASAIKYIDDNFVNILADLEESGKVKIEC